MFIFNTKEFAYKYGYYASYENAEILGSPSQAVLDGFSPIERGCSPGHILSTLCYVLPGSFAYICYFHDPIDF